MVGKSQSVLIMAHPMIFTRTRTLCGADTCGAEQVRLIMMP
jgi:hypothetical protein